MTHLFRVTLPGIKGFARIYEVNDKNTLYLFHKQMLSDMEFPQDQIVLFKAFDANGNVVARYATFDLGQGSIEHITISSIVKEGIVGFEYFYDTTNKKSVLISLEGQGSGVNTMPALIEAKGPNPEAFLNGYVAYEDLPPEKRKGPDEADFDDDDEDDDGISTGEDEEEEIYEETEDYGQDE